MARAPPARSSSATASRASRSWRTAPRASRSRSPRPPGIEVLGPFDVKVSATENYAAWEALLAANPDAKALIGLCAPDIASLGKLQAANAGTPFVSGGYDLTAENLAEIKAGNAYVSLGQTPFMQGYLPIKMLADVVRGTADRRPLGGRLPGCRHGDRHGRQRRGAVRPAAADLRRAGGDRRLARGGPRVLPAPGGQGDRRTGRRSSSPSRPSPSRTRRPDHAQHPGDGLASGDRRHRSAQGLRRDPGPRRAWISPSRPAPSTPSSARTGPASPRS